MVHYADDECSSLQWRKGIETYRSNFDLENDLGGMSKETIWGLATYRGWTVTCFTLHPTHMPEHVTPSLERSRIVFCPPSEDAQDHTRPGMPWHSPHINREYAERAREPVLKYILQERHREVRGDPSLKRLLYNAICSVIVRETYSSELVKLAKSAISWLDKNTGADLTDEIDILEQIEIDEIEIDGNFNMAFPRSIPVKRSDEIDLHGRDLRENCPICDLDIEWYSASESRCTGGHCFGMYMSPGLRPQSIKGLVANALVQFVAV